jgi:transposase InsO family protein
MALKAWDVVDVRLKVVHAVLDGEVSARDAAQQYEVGKTQVYEWVRRYREGGAEALVPLSRRPASSPRQLAGDVEDEIARLRKDRPEWGAKKIRAVLARTGWPVPAVSTVHQVLVRRGLVQGRARQKVPEGGWRRFERPAPNELWQIDGTQHRLADGTEFWVIDLVDDHSRFLLGAQAHPALTTEAAWATLRGTVGRYGMPAQLLSDNGLCFTGRLHDRTVSFERQARAAGITLIHARGRHPQTLGKLERQHGTQNQWFAKTGPPPTLDAAQAVLDAYCADYNTYRPHEGIGQAVPADRYRPGTPVLLPVEEDGPADPFPPGALLRKVNNRGVISYAHRELRVGTRWSGRTVGLIREHNRLHVYYGHSEIETFLVSGVPHPKARGTIAPDSQ